MTRKQFEEQQALVADIVLAFGRFQQTCLSLFCEFVAGNLSAELVAAKERVVEAAKNWSLGSDTSDGEACVSVACKLAGSRLSRAVDALLDVERKAAKL